MPVCVLRRWLVLNTIHFHQVRPMFGQHSTFLLGPILANCQILWGLKIFVWVLRSLGWDLSILLLHFQWLENGYSIEVDVEVEVEIGIEVWRIYDYTLDNRCGIVNNNARYG